MALKLLLLVFICCLCKVHSQQINCTINFDLTEETDDQKYQDFMSELEEFTFSLVDNCPDPAIIDYLVWQYRLVLNRKYEDEVAQCHCLEELDDFDLCMKVVWEMKKSDLRIKRAEYYGFCGANYEKLGEDKYTNVGVFPDYEKMSQNLR
ncbi:hypothetical protein Trydic_g2334 [Trypoxylus dichotomus]